MTARMTAHASNTAHARIHATPTKQKSGEPVKSNAAHTHIHSPNTPAATTFFVYRTPVGAVTIEANDSGITRLVFGNVVFEGLSYPSTLTNQASTELLEYLAGKRRTFDVPLVPAGSEFQLRVWDALRTIPFGETRTSADVARMLNSPDSYRAVGTALGRNPIAVMVPSHRVVQTRHTTTGATTAARNNHNEKLRAFEQAQVRKGTTAYT